MRRRDDLEHSGHTDRIRTERAERADLRRGLELRAVHADVYAASQHRAALFRRRERLFAQRWRIGERHVREARAERSVIRAGQRALSRQVDMVLDEHEIAHLEAGIDAARGIRDDECAHAELLQHIDRISDLVRRVALVAVQTALHTDDAAA